MPTSFNSSLTSKGQVTVPAEIRRLLGLSPHDRVRFVVTDSGVRIEAAGSWVEQTKGVFRGRPALTIADERVAAERAFADEAEPPQTAGG
ncbi:MAG: AbrB/MazE/SpoVT family DNA-binding domain-containing protein [Tepidiformaceae bacterium]